MRGKILYVVSDGGFFVSHRMPIAKAALEEGYSVGIAAPNDQAVVQYSKAGFEFFAIPFIRRKHGLRNELKTIRKLHKVIQEFNPEIVHLITAKPIIYGGVICRYLGVPSISAIPGLGHIFSHDNVSTSILRKLVICAFKTAINSSANHVIFQNSDDVRIFEENRMLRKASYSLIAGCGVDLAKIQPEPLPSGEPVLLLPARMTRNKGVEEFVAVARILREKNVSATFRLVGDPDFGNPTAITQTQLQEWSEEPNIQWQPFTPTIEKELASSHIVVLPSYREGFPKTLIDASAAGRACAASDIPGNRDAIIDGETGVLFPAKNIDAMAKALEELIKDRESQKKMGAAARQHALAHFDVNDVCRQHLGVYEEMLSRT